MRLVIAEKPKVAKAIKSVIPAGGGVYVTSVFGHMLELAQPGEYAEQWKSWSADALPIRVSAWKLNPRGDGRAKERLAEIGRLLKQATEVVHVGDPDREGQLLVDEVLDHFGYRGRVLRMLANATDPKNVAKAWNSLQPNDRFTGLRLSAECRQRADWLVGMNLTRAVTRLLGHGGLVSIGRVQTPTLALVVRRHKQIKTFTEQSFFTFRAKFAVAGGVLEMKCEPKPRILDERLARDTAAGIEGQRLAISATMTQKRHMSPLPFDLGGFQGASEDYYGWTIKHALDAAQAAYDAGLTSYPRVDCAYLPAEQADDALPIARSVMKALNVDPGMADMMQAKPRIYDSSKVSVHHGIVPTGQLPKSDTPPDAVKAWKLISLHFLQCLLPDETYNETELRASVTERVPDAAPLPLAFIRRGEQITNTGANWRLVDVDAFIPPVRQRTGPKKDAMLPIPPVADGEVAACSECVRKRGKTTPPKPYTERTLRQDMDDVGKYVTDERLKKVLKETSGIGTPATQANIIETLKSRGYIKLERGKLDATPTGVAIIDTIPPSLSDPGVTAAWEEALKDVEGGNYEADTFMARVDSLIVRHLDKIRSLHQQGKRIAGTERDERKVGSKKRPKGKRAGGGRTTSTPNRSRGTGAAPKAGKATKRPRPGDDAWL